MTHIVHDQELYERCTWFVATTRVTIRLDFEHDFMWSVYLDRKYNVDTHVTIRMYELFRCWVKLPKAIASKVREEYTYVLFETNHIQARVKYHETWILVNIEYNSTDQWNIQVESNVCLWFSVDSVSHCESQTC
jgi:hypothetical protein